MGIMERLRAHPRVAATIVVVLVIVALAATAPPTPPPGPSPTPVARTTASATAEVIKSPVLTPSPSPLSSATPAAQPSSLAQVRAILTGVLTQYVTALQVGQEALGQTPYPDAGAALAALADPDSPAAKFSAWQRAVQQPLERNDPMLPAFEQADAYFTADNEPPAMDDWRNDMIQLDADLNLWTQTAVSWQDSTATTAALRARQTALEADVKAVRHDIDAVAPAD